MLTPLTQQLSKRFYQLISKSAHKLQKVGPKQDMQSRTPNIHAHKPSMEHGKPHKLRVYRQLKLAFLCTLCINLVLPCLAQAKLAPRYQFNVILFSHISKTQLEAEHWPQLDNNILHQNGGVPLLASPPLSPSIIDAWQATLSLKPDSSPTSITKPVSTNTPNSDPTSTASPPTDSSNSTMPTLNLPAQITTALERAKQTHISYLGPKDSLFSNTELRQLGRAGQNIIAVLSWVQNTADLQRGVNFHLLAGAAYPNPANTITPPGSDNKASTTNQQVANTIYPISGQIRLSLDRFFNFKFNLVYTEPLTKLKKIDSKFNQHKQWGKWVYFHLRQSRRMRSKEINYIDHPLYGLLIKIKPIFSDNTK